DSTAVGYVYRRKSTAVDVATARKQAISYAAYRILKERYVLSKNAATTLPALDAQMVALGFDTNNVSLDISTPIGIGNSVAAAVSAYFINDGSYQTTGYAYPTGDPNAYASVNPPLVVAAHAASTVDPNRWQPLLITNAVSQNGIPVGTIQSFVGAMWLGVRPFALTRSDSTKPWIDPGPP